MEVGNQGVFFLCVFNSLCGRSPMRKFGSIRQSEQLTCGTKATYKEAAAASSALCTSTPPVPPWFEPLGFPRPPPWDPPGLDTRLSPCLTSYFSGQSFAMWPGLLHYRKCVSLEARKNPSCVTLWHLLLPPPPPPPPPTPPPPELLLFAGPELRPCPR